MTNEQKPDEVVVPLEFHIPSDMIATYTSHIAIQIAESEVFVNFFQLMPPPQIRPPVQTPETVRAECVARIVLTKQRLLEFAEVFQSTAQKVTQPSAGGSAGG